MPLALPTSTSTTLRNTDAALAFFRSKPVFRRPVSDGVTSGGEAAAAAPTFDQARGGFEVEAPAESSGPPRAVLVAGGVAALGLAAFVVYRLKHRRG